MLLLQIYTINYNYTTIW